MRHAPARPPPPRPGAELISTAALSPNREHRHSPRHRSQLLRRGRTSGGRKNEEDRVGVRARRQPDKSNGGTRQDGASTLRRRGQQRARLRMRIDSMLSTSTVSIVVWTTLWPELDGDDRPASCGEPSGAGDIGSIQCSAGFGAPGRAPRLRPPAIPERHPLAPLAAKRPAAAPRLLGSTTTPLFVSARRETMLEGANHMAAGDLPGARRKRAGPRRQLGGEARFTNRQAALQCDTSSLVEHSRPEAAFRRAGRQAAWRTHWSHVGPAMLVLLGVRV